MDRDAFRPVATHALNKSLASALANNTVENGESGRGDISYSDEQAIAKVPQQTKEQMAARNTVRLYTAWLRVLYRAEDSITEKFVEGMDRTAYVPAQFPTTTDACVTDITNDDGEGTTLGIKATRDFIDVPIFNNLLQFAFKHVSDRDGLNHDQLKRLMTAILCFSYFEVVKHETQIAVDRHLKEHGAKQMSNRTVELFAKKVHEQIWSSA